MTVTTRNSFDDRSLGELLGQLGSDSALLLRQEIDLAKTEMTEKAVAAGTGAALGIVAAVVAIGAFGAGIAAGIAGLANILPTWAAALIVFGGLLLIATVLGLVGALRIKSSMPLTPERAIETGKETPNELFN